METVRDLTERTLNGVVLQNNINLLDHKDSILDLKHWRIIGITPAKKKQRGSILIMKHRTEEKYCTQYLHSGQYFDNMEDLLQYANKRGWTPLNIER